MDDHLSTLGQDFNKHEMCELMAEMRSGGMREACDHSCQDEVTTLYQMTGCLHTPCTDCAAVYTTVGAWEAQQVRKGSPNLPGC